MSTRQTEQQDFSGLAGQLLLAMPGMGDPRFHRAVIFICAHDANGAMGLMLNQPSSGLTFPQLLKQLDIKPERTIPDQLTSLPVMSGGPVETARGFVLHGPDFEDPGTVPVDDEFYVTGTVDGLKAIAAGEGPDHMLFMLGYAGWTAGQLEDELRQNAWLTLPATPDLIFHTQAGHMWDRAIGTLGIDPAMLSAEAGRA